MTKITLYIRAGAFYFGLVVSSLVLLPLLVLILPLPPVVSRYTGRYWSSLNVWWLKVTCGIRVRFKGIRYIADTPVLYAAKHQSALETLALGAVITHTACVVKRSLFYIPIFGWFLWRAGMIGIDRRRGSKAFFKMKQDSVSAIGKGCNIAIFPEGTRTRVGAAPQYKNGVYNMYKILDVPVVPIALNTGLYWPRNQFTKTAGTATIQFLKPITTGLSKAEFMATLQHRIETQTNTLCG